MKKTFFINFKSKETRIKEEMEKIIGRSVLDIERKCLKDRSSRTK